MTIYTDWSSVKQKWQEVAFVVTVGFIQITGVHICLALQLNDFWSGKLSLNISVNVSVD